MLLEKHNHRGIYIAFSWRVHHRKGFTFFFFFFYHLGQEAVWFDIGSNFIFKQNMRNTGEETALCSLKLVAEKTELQKYSLMHSLDEHVPWLTQHWGALGVQQDCTFSSKVLVFFFLTRILLLGLWCPVVHICVKCQQLTLASDSAIPFGKGSWNQIHLRPQPSSTYRKMIKKDERHGQIVIGQGGMA